MAETRTLTPAEMDRIASRIATSRDGYRLGIYGETDEDVAAYWLQALPLNPRVTEFNDAFCEAFCHHIDNSAQYEAGETFERGGYNRAANWMRLANLAQQVGFMISLYRQGRIDVSIPTLNRIRVSFLTIVRDFRPDRNRNGRTFTATEEILHNILRCDAVRPASVNA